jgi:hypothetical protein
LVSGGITAIGKVLRLGPVAVLGVAAAVAVFVARSCARSNMALKADWPDAAQFIV